MKSLRSDELLQMACKASRKWGMYISFPSYQSLQNSFEDHVSELRKSAPYIDDIGISALIDGFTYLLFDSEVEMFEAYRATIGDDGPFHDGVNPRVYALTCNPDGQLLSENT